MAAIHQSLRWIAIMASAFVLLGFSAEAAEACSCIGTYSGNPACQARWQYTQIFRGTVKSIAPAPPDSTGAVRGGAARISFDVLEGFLGVDSRAYELNDPGSSCSYPFEVGKEYLVYVYRGQVGICSPTRTIESAAADLKYLRAIPAIPPRDGAIRGLVMHEEYAQLERKPTPFANARIVVEGQGLRRAATTGTDGSYEIRLPAGKYRVHADVDEHMYAAPLYRGEVELIDTRGCAIADFSVHFNGRVNSRVVTRDGKPVPHLALRLVSTSEPRSGDRAGQTDEHGRLRLEHIPPGRFVLGFDVPDQASKAGRTTFFLPGTTDQLAARSITVGPSEVVELGDFVIPDTMRFVTLTGSVQDPFGNPIERGSVYLVLGAESHRVEPMVRMGPETRFSFALLEGHEYTVVAESYLGWLGIATVELKVLAAPDLKPVVLIPIRK